MTLWRHGMAHFRVLHLFGRVYQELWAVFEPILLAGAGRIGAAGVAPLARLNALRTLQLADCCGVDGAAARAFVAEASAADASVARAAAAEGSASETSTSEAPVPVSTCDVGHIGTRERCSAGHDVQLGNQFGTNPNEAIPVVVSCSAPLCTHQRCDQGGGPGLNPTWMRSEVKRKTCLAYVLWQEK
jgi:hypothetical protein